MIEAETETPLHGNSEEAQGTHALWTVITSDTRILSFRSAEEVRVAILAGLLHHRDRLMGDGGSTLEEHDEFAAIFSPDTLPEPAPLSYDEQAAVRARPGDTQPYGGKRRRRAPPERAPVAIDSRTQGSACRPLPAYRATTTRHRSGASR